METLTLAHVKRLYMRFASIFGERFTRNHKTEELVNMWLEDWLAGLSGVEPLHIKLALEDCLLNREWAPSICEFRKMCEKHSCAIPSEDKIYDALLRREFLHPIIEQIYNKIGSWDMRRISADDLRKKIHEFREEFIHQQRLDQSRQARINQSPELSTIETENLSRLNDQIKLIRFDRQKNNAS